MKKQLTPYQDLVERVRKIEPDAARYMETKARRLKSFNEEAMLFNCFDWDEATQGIEYWIAISDHVDEGLDYVPKAPAIARRFK